MKITKLELKNFKRFDDLTIDMTSLPEPAKLVLLIGTNGSGKSSVFDAFQALNNIVKRSGVGDDYYQKERSKDFSVVATSDQKDASGDYWVASKRLNYGSEGFKNDSLYGRTSIRQVPKLTRRRLGEGNFSFAQDSDRSFSFIDRDNRFENDIEKVTSSILTEVFNTNNTTEQIKRNYLDPINKALENVFGSNDSVRIKLISIKPPLEGNTAEILFEKGVSKIPYDYLSSGEKEIFNILLDLLVRREYYQDTVYFLDEIDLHLNTQLQKSLLKELTENWIPDNCQLWTASHSLGFIDYANETENAAIIDLDNLNFDIPQVVTPSPKNNFDVFEIAVSKEFLSTVFEGKRIVFSENKNTSNYNSLNIEDTIFFNGIDKKDVFFKSKNSPNYAGLIDRDYLTDEERKELMQVYKNLYILNYYSIENYFYHPDNLEEYYNSIAEGFDKEGYKKSLQEEGKVIRDKILIGLAGARDGYPFYRENENNARLKSMKTNAEKIIQLFDSEDFEDFYKVFPAKDYGTQVKERQNIKPNDLCKTQWFKDQISQMLFK